MNTPTSRAGFAVPALALLLSPAVAAAGTLNPWGARLDDGAGALTPYVYVMPDGVVTPSTYVQASFADHFDFIGGVGGTITPGAGGGLSAIDLMPRVFVTETLGLSLRTIVAPDGSVAYGPEADATLSQGRVAVTVNVGHRRQGAPEDALTYAIFAPELFLGDRVSVFLEVDPSYAASSGAALLAVPGVSLAFDAEAVHTAAVGVQVDALAGGAPSVGLWYSKAFSTGRRAPAPVVAALDPR
jgi:hypothetical protein